MPNYRRDYSSCCWFFTVVLKNRRPLFLDEVARTSLRLAIDECRERYPFKINGWVLLPNHLHCVWTMPEHDRDYSRRWSIIKRRFTQLYRTSDWHGPPYWQERFWAHRIDDEEDYRRHLDYIHLNPVKHGLTVKAVDWPWSTFHRYVAEGVYPPDWYLSEKMLEDTGSE